MYYVIIIIINFPEDLNRSFLDLGLDLKSPELELELKSLELELELKLIVSSGIGIGIENNRIGIGIELKNWNWPQPCLTVGMTISIYPLDMPDLQHPLIQCQPNFNPIFTYL